jgi:hypothetical protein
MGEINNYRFEVKRIADFNHIERQQSIDLASSIFNPKSYLRDTVENFYFHYKDDRQHVLTYFNNDIIGVHQLYPIQITKDIKVLNFALAVIDKNHRGIGLSKQANKMRVDIGKSYDCPYATVRTFSPKSAYYFSKCGFYNPIICNRNNKLDAIGILSGITLGDNINTDLMIDIKKSDASIFDYTPMQEDANNQEINKILKENLIKGKRMRLVSEL